MIGAFLTVLFAAVVVDTIACTAFIKVVGALWLCSDTMCNSPDEEDDEVGCTHVRGGPNRQYWDEEVESVVWRGVSSKRLRYLSPFGSLCI
jgi:hypothetical protein